MPVLHFLVAFILCLQLFSCKQKQFGCADVKNGTFHVYPGEGKEHYMVNRQDTLQTEMNLNAGTTSYWKITWTSDCSYLSQYLSGGNIGSKAQEDFYKSTAAKFSILQVTKDYYLFTGTITSPNGKQYTYTDTTWSHEK